jgi:retinol dehydrogenase 12
MEIEAQASRKGQAFPLLEVMQLDLASLESVRRFASAWMSRNLPLDVLVCNAGLFAMGASRTETADGLEMHMATNHLGHFLLSLLLLPSMQAASKARGRPARVVSVSSRLHLMGRLHRSDPNMTLAGSYSSLAAYAQSKLAQVCFSSELTRRSAGSVRGIALHPGEVATEVVRTLPAPLQAAYRAIMGIILLTPAQGEIYFLI